MSTSKRGCPARSRPYPFTRGADGAGVVPLSRTNPGNRAAVVTTQSPTQPPFTDQFLQWIQAAVQQQIGALATATTSSCTFPRLATPACASAIRGPASAVYTAPPYGSP